MKLTLSVSYAVGVLMQIDQYSGEDGPVTAAQIARGCRFPPRFLYRVLRRLVDAGLLSGISGPRGGYALARSPNDITLLDIVAAVEGAPQPTVLAAACGRQRDAIARVNQLCRQSADRFSEELEDATLSDLIKMNVGGAGPRKRLARAAGRSRT